MSYLTKITGLPVRQLTNQGKLFRGGLVMILAPSLAFAQILLAR